MKAKDFLGRELKVGDEVVFMEVEYRSLKKGTIERLTNKMVFIKDGRVKYLADQKSHPMLTKQFQNQVIRL